MVQDFERRNCSVFQGVKLFRKVWMKALKIQSRWSVWDSNSRPLDCKAKHSATLFHRAIFWNLKWQSTRKTLRQFHCVWCRFIGVIRNSSLRWPRVSRTKRFWFSTGQDSLLLHHILNCSGCHPVLYTVNTRGLSMVRDTRKWSCPFPHIVEFKNAWNITTHSTHLRSFLHTSMQRGVTL
jgi:hypothetical protein